MMDDIIDLELEKIDAILDKINSDPESEEVKRIERNLWVNIRRKAVEGRRTGIGITAEGDMLAALGLQYGSAEAINFSVEVHKQLALNVYASSVDLAETRGQFPLYDTKKELNNPFINRLKEADPELYGKMTIFGRRNIAMLTIAPTGSTSTLSQTTSGIEPVYDLIYKRNRKVNPNDKNVNVSYTDKKGDSWETFLVVHHKFAEWLQLKGYNVDEVKEWDKDKRNQLVSISPYNKSSAYAIDWINKVKMQGAVQKWVDHSISVTVNLPKDVNEETVAKIYFEGWKSGCKGITVYRDGSRGRSVLEDDNDGEDYITIEKKIRPQKLDAIVKLFKNGEENWIAFVGILDEKPYEIFTGKIEEDLKSKLENDQKGYIIKTIDMNGEKRYDFLCPNPVGYDLILSGLSKKFNSEFWNYAKLISGALRYDMPVENIVTLVESMHFDCDNINTWKAGVTRALKSFIKKGTRAEGKVCDDCKSTNLRWQEGGCLICLDCGTAKC
jgi:ribonucleoside-diphosphate reductase alpha chain